MTLTCAAVAERLPRQLIKIGLRLSLILAGSLLATATVAVGQSSSRPVARLAASGPMTRVTLNRPRTVSSEPTRAAASERMPAVSANVASLERRAFDLINAQRRQRGQQPVVWDAELSRLARQHSENMARNEFFNHRTPGGVTMVDRARGAGIRGWSALGENIAYNQGYEDPAGFVAERWMVSSKHRDNALNARWTRSAIGVAIASDGRVFFTQVFIAP
ncbi:MAG: CAP domain-containing protein [Pyrinomonadaceae bacterium]|nr:CAP domain-containing protein [Pyrinomonadaceae bacterium]